MIFVGKDKGTDCIMAALMDDRDCVPDAEVGEWLRSWVDQGMDIGVIQGPVRLGHVAPCPHAKPVAAP